MMRFHKPSRAIASYQFRGKLEAMIPLEGALSMFDPRNVTKLSVPRWQEVYRAELLPNVVAMIAVHDTTLGWSLGGCRMSVYRDEASALTDVLRLSRGMTFKNAAAKLPMGGGKAVLICDPSITGEARDCVFREFGKFVAWVNSDRDIYYTAEDMNTKTPDLAMVSTQTRNAFGTSNDPSPLTAYGTFCAMEFATGYFADDLFDGRPSLKDKRVLVQGLGKVGMSLLQQLGEVGASCLVSDINEAAIETARQHVPNLEVVAPDAVIDTEVDIYAPCAMGEVIRRDNLDKLNFKMICGAANNQLQDEITDQMLHASGRVSVPDYLANMGGVICVYGMEVEGLSSLETKRRIQETVSSQLQATFSLAAQQNLTFNQAIDRMVTTQLWGNTRAVAFNTASLFAKSLAGSVS
jgi:leucine dehydrogenase